MSQCNDSVVIELAQSPSPPIPQTPRLPGYPSFAHFISQDGDAAIYRRYESLSARNLLYLQSELHELEGQLEALDAEDAKDRQVDDKESQKIARLWHHYARAGNARAVRHRDLQGKIRAKIKEYRTYTAIHCFGSELMCRRRGTGAGESGACPQRSNPPEPGHFQAMVSSLSSTRTLGSR